MRKLIAYACALCLAVGCVAASAVAEGGAEASGVLVVYFSRHGTSLGDTDADAASSASLSPGDVAQLTEYVHAAVGGDLFQIITVAPYPKDYTATTEVATAEQRDDARPQLAALVEDMAAYDTIYLGYPIWWGTMPMAVKGFLEAYDLTGKTIIPYCAHEGSGLGRSLADLSALCPGATIADGLAVRGRDVAGAQAQVEGWLALH